MLKGMNASKDTFKLVAEADFQAIPQLMLEAVAFTSIDINFDNGSFTFGGKTKLQDAPIICVVEANKESGEVNATVASSEAVLNSLLLKHIKNALTRVKPQLQ